MPERLTTTEPSAPASSLPIFAQAPAGPTHDELHELRVRIPLHLHRQLLSLKVLRGRSLAETVSLALDMYFENHQREKQGLAPREDA